MFAKSVPEPKLGANGKDLSQLSEKAKKSKKDNSAFSILDPEDAKYEEMLG